MTDADILVILKVDLQLSTDALDNYLLALIASAKEYISTEGIVLSTGIGDAMLVEMYAAYLYRQRREKVVAMPRMLRWALNNRLMEQKAGDRVG
jgi:hypothetical protein|nr:MAG TPA: Head Tail Connector Protein [Caudoviricetes sp.]